MRKSKNLKRRMTMTMTIVAEEKDQNVDISIAYMLMPAHGWPKYWDLWW
jgi:hypothetical protein